MNILMVLPSAFPPDIRVEKEARSLMAAGFSVHVLCPRNANQSRKETFRGIEITRLDLGKLADIIPLPYIWNPAVSRVWRKEIGRIVREEGVVAIHVHDLPVVKIAIAVGKKTGLPVVFDMHENWPEALKVYSRNRSKLSAAVRVFIHRKRERFCIEQSDRIVVVVDEQRERLVRMGIARNKITVVMNTEDLENFAESGEAARIKREHGNWRLITYVGAFGFHRGLDTAIRAMALVNKTIPKAKLLLIGRGKNSEQLKRLCAELGLEGVVEFTGWVDFKLVPDYIKASEVCLVPHESNPHTDTTIPHKIFQYMLLEKPVVVTDAKPLQRIAEETGCALVVRSNDPVSMADAIRRILNDVDLQNELGKHGREAVLNKYNWRIESDKLVSLYRTLAT